MRRFYGGDDTWMLHYGSIQEYRKLVTQPLQFFADFDLTASFRRNEGLAAGWYFLLSDLEYWIITKPLAIFNIRSRGNYYVNIVFFNLLTFWGQYLVFKVFAVRFPQRRRLLVLLVFLIPYWFLVVAIAALLFLTTTGLEMNEIPYRRPEGDPRQCISEVEQGMKRLGEQPGAVDGLDEFGADRDVGECGDCEEELDGAPRSDRNPTADQNQEAPPRREASDQGSRG